MIWGENLRHTRSKVQFLQWCAWVFFQRPAMKPPGDMREGNQLDCVEMFIFLLIRCCCQFNAFQSFFGLQAWGTLQRISCRFASNSPSIATHKAARSLTVFCVAIGNQKVTLKHQSAWLFLKAFSEQFDMQPLNCEQQLQYRMAWCLVSQARVNA